MLSSVKEGNRINEINIITQHMPEKWRSASHYAHHRQGMETNRKAIISMEHSSYPDADLSGELRRIEEWFQKHPDRRKTERGMRAFVKTWLDRKIRGAAVSQHGTKRGKYQNAFNDFSLRQEYDFEELEADLLSISGGRDTNESTLTLDHRGPK